MENQNRKEEPTSKKNLPPNINQISVREYEELRKKEIEKLKKKKEKRSSPLRMVGLIFSFLLAAFALFILGFLGFSLITAAIK